MSCPFYGASVVFRAAGGAGRVMQNPMPGNQCALITSAHSPCWMEAIEGTPPDWEHCPRNPDLLAGYDSVTAERLAVSLDWLRRARAPGNNALGPGGET